MLYTRKGDSGTTKTLHCDQRLSKTASIAEALGTVDELDSWLGVCRAHCQGEALKIPQGLALREVVKSVQHNLFIVQAHLAGADKKLSEDSVKEIEKIIDEIEQKLPPIKSFFLPGAGELGAYFDFARTIARRAERRTVRVKEEGQIAVDPVTLQYLNRLSSLLYALARWANHQSGAPEEAPHY